MTITETNAPYSRLYALGDSLTDYANYIPWITPPNQPSVREDFGYSLSITNRQGDLDGDGIDEGKSYPQGAVEAFGLADGVRNVAVASARTIGERTLGDALAGAVGPDGTTLLDLLGPQLPPQRLEIQINLTAQVNRVLRDFAAQGRPDDAIATFLVGSNDLAAALSSLAETLPSGLGLPQTLALLPEITSTIAGVVATTVAGARRLDAAGIDNVVLLTNPAADLPVTNLLGEAGAQLGRAVVGLLNSSLEAAFAGLAIDPRFGAEVEVVELARFIEAVAADPSNYNLVSFEEPYYLAAGPIPITTPFGIELLQPLNPRLPFDAPDDRSFFVDVQHFNANAHDLIAAFLDASLTSDVLFGSDAGERVSDDGRADHDAVFAGGGDDIVQARRGDDVVFGGAGDDLVLGGPGDDILAGGSGDDWIDGGAARRAKNSVLTSGWDVLAGNAGDDTLLGRQQADALFDGLGSDRVAGGGGGDVVFHVDEALIGGGAGSADRDVFNGGPGRDTLVLVLADAADRDTASAAIDAARGPKGLSRFDIPEIGVTGFGFERVLVFDERGRPTDLGLSPRLEAQLELADYWAVALPEREGFTAGLAVYDSDLALV